MIPKGSDGSLMLTSKQHHILTLIAHGDVDASDGASVGAISSFVPIDLNQLLERLPYKTTKASMHFSLRSLIRRELILKGQRERRRGRLRATLLPTELGKAIIIPPAPPLIEPAGVGELLDLLE